MAGFCRPSFLCLFSSLTEFPFSEKCIFTIQQLYKADAARYEQNNTRLKIQRINHLDQTNPQGQTLHGDHVYVSYQMLFRLYSTKQETAFSSLIHKVVDLVG